MKKRTEHRTSRPKNAETIPSSRDLISQPASLTATIQVGLIVTEHDFTAGPVLESIKKVILRLEDVLAATPHSYRFILPHQAGPEHIILGALLADSSIREGAEPPEITLISCGKGELDARLCPFEGDVDFDIEVIHEEDATPGCNPVHDEITDRCTLILLVGEWEPDAARYWAGSVFDIARNHGRTIIVVNPVNGNHYERDHDDMIFDSYAQLNQYNKEKISLDLYTAGYQRHLAYLHNEAQKASLNDEILKPIYGSLFPYFTRTRILADKYQRLYAWTGTCVSLLAALAVATITFQTLFLPEMPWLSGWKCLRFP